MEPKIKKESDKEQRDTHKQDYESSKQIMKKLTHIFWKMS